MQEGTREIRSMGCVLTVKAPKGAHLPGSTIFAPTIGAAKTVPQPAAPERRGGTRCGNDRGSTKAGMSMSFREGPKAPLP